MNLKKCKICDGNSLNIFAHTAKCENCGVLLYFPYPPTDMELIASGEGKAFSKQEALWWYSNSSFLNHLNFTEMLRFTMDKSYLNKAIDILDFGGGGGQFALVCKSHYPQASIYITDISDEALLEEWKCSNIQIPFNNFSNDKRKFDVIFLNDVFEHLSDPLITLQLLGDKLKENGKIFIDTPKQFWIYPLTKIISSELYKKVLRGTVSTAHLQIWTRSSFNFVIRQSGLTKVKYLESSEYTMPPDFYMVNMGITNPILKIIGRMFYKSAKYLAKNKILCVLQHKVSIQSESK